MKVGIGIVDADSHSLSAGERCLIGECAIPRLQSLTVKLSPRCKNFEDAVIEGRCEKRVKSMGYSQLRLQVVVDRKLRSIPLELTRIHAGSSMQE